MHILEILGLLPKEVNVKKNIMIRTDYITAPEEFAENKVSHLTDTYAIGILIFEFISVGNGFEQFIKSASSNWADAKGCPMPQKSW